MKVNESKIGERVTVQVLRITKYWNRKYRTGGTEKGNYVQLEVTNLASDKITLSRNYSFLHDLKQNGPS